MNLENITLAQIKELKQIIGEIKEHEHIDSFCIGKEVIIRTYSAGVWFGTLDKKCGNEVILSNARRMWYWHAKKSGSLSGVIKYGIKDESKIAPAIAHVWLEAIEIMPICDDAAKSIRDYQEWVC